MHGSSPESVTGLCRKEQENSWGMGGNRKARKGTVVTGERKVGSKVGGYGSD
jgi:hypothetical protein